MPLKYASSMVGYSYSDLDLEKHEKNVCLYKAYPEFKDELWQARIGTCTCCDSITTVLNPVFRKSLSDKTFLCISCCFPRNKSMIRIPSLDRQSSGSGG